MRPILLAMLGVSFSLPLAAETMLHTLTSSAAAIATPVTTPLSTPAVTPDPRFTMPGYAEKWPHISLDEAKRLHARKDVVFVDGRARMEWDQSHIPGAISLPLSDFQRSYSAEGKRLKHARIIVSYCHGEGCRLSDLLAQKLVDSGHHNVAVFWGGYPAWTQAGLPMQDKNGKTVANQSAAPASAPAH